MPPPFTHLNRDVKPRARELVTDDYVNVLSELISAGLKRVHFTGGERKKIAQDRVPVPVNDQAKGRITDRRDLVEAL